MLLAAGPKQSISLDQGGGEASVPRLPPHAPPYHLRTKCLIGSHYVSRKKPALLGNKLGSHKMARRWAAPWSQIPEKVVFATLQRQITFLASSFCRMACPIFLLARAIGCSVPPTVSSSTRGNFSVRKSRRLRTCQDQPSEHYEWIWDAWMCRKEAS